jgi:hypothetical protein
MTKPFLGHTYLFIVLPFLSFQNAIYVFNTEDNDGVEYYDCIKLDRIPYCRRPVSPIDLRRNNPKTVCHSHGKSKSFDDVYKKYSTAKKIIDNFDSSIEKAEEYALYLDGQANSSYLCECNKKFFGKHCEYELINGDRVATFTESQKWQNQQKENNRLEVQASKKTLCYTTLTCDSGLLCLDWRDICDGRQQCMHGSDEEACDLLEFNECEKDEYRCSNGMCIPDVYLLDGKIIFTSKFTQLFVFLSR